MPSGRGHGNTRIERKKRRCQHTHLWRHACAWKNVRSHFSAAAVGVVILRHLAWFLQSYIPQVWHLAIPYTYFLRFCARDGCHSDALFLLHLASCRDLSVYNGMDIRPDANNSAISSGLVGDVTQSLKRGCQGYVSWCEVNISEGKQSQVLPPTIQQMPSSISGSTPAGHRRGSSAIPQQ
ncbi:hypothetical protein GE09DRAFT_55477 [Coniochaeta sp. 2T2.1]|nr:hypothetical protein GE09DRAFT_55477 [Coniochaeta sp. 2T2.1]